ncbi:hypothetical protein PV326_007737 [Microctonus aethiopoides]|nr:hypothetical protein PV326_007737 [Microctonus aethiopoides]
MMKMFGKSATHLKYTEQIYCKFRRGFAQFFAWCPWVNVEPEPALSRSEAVTSRYSCTGSPDGHTRISRNGTSTCSSSDRSLCTITSNTPHRDSIINEIEDKINARDGTVTDHQSIHSIDLCEIPKSISTPPILPIDNHLLPSNSHYKVNINAMVYNISMCTVRIPLHLQPARGMALGNNNRFPAHHRGHGRRWGVTQPERHVS